MVTNSGRALEFLKQLDVLICKGLDPFEPLQERWVRSGDEPEQRRFVSRMTFCEAIQSRPELVQSVARSKNSPSLGAQLHGLVLADDRTRGPTRLGS